MPTRGPYRYDAGRQHISSTEGRIIAQMLHAGESKDQDHQNGRLLAAAWRLASALANLVILADDITDEELNTTGWPEQAISVYRKTLKEGYDALSEAGYDLD